MALLFGRYTHGIKNNDYELATKLFRVGQVARSSGEFRKVFVLLGAQVIQATVFIYRGLNFIDEDGMKKINFV